MLIWAHKCFIFFFVAGNAVNALVSISVNLPRLIDLKMADSPCLSIGFKLDTYNMFQALSCTPSLCQNCQLTDQYKKYLLSRNRNLAWVLYLCNYSVVYMCVWLKKTSKICHCGNGKYWLCKRKSLIVSCQISDNPIYISILWVRCCHSQCVRACMCVCVHVCSLVTCSVSF